MRLLTFVLFLFLTLDLMSQKDTLTDRQLIYTFKQIMKTDQTHVKDSEIRDLIFQRNLTQIINITKSQGFPVLKEAPKRRRDRHIIFDGSMITFIHILQSNPKLLLDEEVIKLFKQEIDQNRMPDKLLTDIILVWYELAYMKNKKGENTQKLDEDVEKLYLNALKILEIE